MKQKDAKDFVHILKVNILKQVSDRKVFDEKDGNAIIDLSGSIPDVQQTIYILLNLQDELREIALALLTKVASIEKADNEWPHMMLEAIVSSFNEDIAALTDSLSKDKVRH